MKGAEALAAVAVVAFATGAEAQERRRLAMPAGMENPAQVEIVDADMPLGIPRLLGSGAPGDPRLIASSGEPAPNRLHRIDFYNGLTRTTLEQFRDGRFPGRPGSESLQEENRWTVPPSVGVIVQRPVGAANAAGNAPASLGLNAGPNVAYDGTPYGMSINARVRMPFGR